MKKVALLLFVCCLNLLSFAQNTIKLFTTDYYSFKFPVAELTYFMRTDTIFNKWSYLESDESDFFMVFEIDFSKNQVLSSVDQGDTSDIYTMININKRNNNAFDFQIKNMNNTVQNVAYYELNGSFRFIRYYLDGEYVFGYVAKDVSIL